MEREADREYWRRRCKALDAAAREGEAARASFAGAEEGAKASAGRGGEATVGMLGAGGLL